MGYLVSPSGVAHITKNMIEEMLKTGKYTFVSLGGAIKHQDYRPMKTEQWGDDWIIHPVDGYGNAEIVRSVLINERPDILWFMTDPRFWDWLWMIENEIRPHVSMVYHNIWDNYPYPHFNKPYYESNDYLVTISKITQDIVEVVAPNTPSCYLPHSVNTDVFKKLPAEKVQSFRNESFSQSKQSGGENKFIFFWNSRNARRKMSGSIIFWFKEFLDKIGHDKATLIMHTDPKDQNGQDLEYILEFLNMTDGQVLFSKQKVPQEVLALVYNMADCLINVSNAEGFGLSVIESLACETPAIVNMTGGMQEQITDGKNVFGVAIQPASQAIIGSQNVPWIYEDVVSKEDFINALEKMYNTTKQERNEMGKLARQHVLQNFNYKDFGKKWDEIFTEIYEKNGSWETRKNYTPWKLVEIKQRKQQPKLKVYNNDDI